MPRVKRGNVRRAKRKKLLARAKGFYQTKSKLYRSAKESVDTALKYAFVGRRRKKRDFRRLWVVRINAAARENGLTYGQLIAGLKAAGNPIDRKQLADLAVASPKAFALLAKAAADARPAATGLTMVREVQEVHVVQQRSAEPRGPLRPLESLTRPCPPIRLSQHSRPPAAVRGRTGERSHRIGGAGRPRQVPRAQGRARLRPPQVARTDAGGRPPEARPAGQRPEGPHRGRARSETAERQRRPPTGRGGRHHAPRTPAAHRPPPSAHHPPRAHRGHLHALRLPRHRGRRARRRLPQLRSAQHAARASRARHAGHAVPLGAGALGVGHAGDAAADAHVGDADPLHGERISRRSG